MIKKLTTLAILTPVCVLANSKTDIAQDSKSPKRPNILWLTFEDTSPQFIGCYGDTHAKTPTMDTLSNYGVRFTSAFSTGTVSSASRFCLFTGITPPTMGTGQHRSSYPIPEFVKGFPAYLRNAGYYTTNNSKRDYNNAREWPMTREAWNESSGKAGWWNRKDGEPFFAVFNFNDSHQSRTMTNPWDNYVARVLNMLQPEHVTAQDEQFEMPPFYRDSKDMRKQVSRVYNSISLVDEKMAKLLKRLDDEGLRDDTIIFCFSDHGQGIPRGKGSSLALGYQVPLIVSIPEKWQHLSPWQSGTVTNQVVSFDDFGATVLALAGVEIPDYIQGTAFMGENIPAAKEYFYGSCDNLASGHELSRTVSDGEYLYTRVFTPHKPFVSWMPYYDHGRIQKLMRADFAQGQLNETQEEILKPRHNEYLYNIKQDKWEVHNLAQDPKYRSVLKKFRGLMIERILQLRDAQFIPEYSLQLISKTTTAYDYRQNDKDYPLEQILSAAMLNGEGKKAVKKQIKLLSEENDYVQYWASVGLFDSREYLMSHTKELEQALATMSYTPAKLYIAAIIYELTRSESSKKVLTDGMYNENQAINVTTIQTLLEMEIEAAKSLLPMIKASAEQNKKKWEVKNLMNVVLLRLEGKDFRYETFW